MRRLDHRAAACLIGATLVAGFTVAARAQTEDYFATPWIVAPLPPSSSPSATSSASASPTAQSGIRSNMYSQAIASSAPPAPPVIYSFDVGVDEIATDNVAESENDRVADLGSLFSAGGTITADSERLTGVLSATGTYRRDLNDTQQDQFSEFAYGSGQGVVLPGNLYMSVYGMIDDLATLGGGLQDPLVQAGENTHEYTVGGSPYLVFNLRDIGLNVLRYQVGEGWFTTPAQQQFFGPPPSPLTASTDQSVREDFKMAGTILPRLMSDVSLSGTEDNAGNLESGDLQIATGELLNEYEITRAISVIGGGGYEALHDPEVPVANGQDPIWDFGGRLRPNADSYVLILYGRHNRKSDFAGEVAWRLTPLTDIYASYTDSLASMQQSIAYNNASSLLGPDGAVTDVNFDQNPVIGVLDDTILNAAPGNESAMVPIGIPIGTSNNYTPLQNGLFRTRILSGSARTLLEGQDSIILTAYDVRQISYTPFFVPSSASEGGNLTWSPVLSPSLTGSAAVGYAHGTGLLPGDVYNASVGATYMLSDTLTLALRYDLIHRTAGAGAGGFLQNAVTLGLHKSFD